jgi:small-conductance mechanosensitive channel
MDSFLEHIDINQYLPMAVDWATNLVLALFILIIGIWLAGKAYKAVVSVANRYDKLDDTLFKFFGSVAKYTVLAFVGIAVLNRFGIAYSESIDDARAVIQSVLQAHPHILSEPAPFVEVESLNNSSVDFLVRPFCQGAHYFDVLYSVPEQVKKALDEANIEIPFPHRKVILVNESNA